jgi:hypothetical protein
MPPTTRVTQQLAKESNLFSLKKKSPFLARQHPPISLKPQKSPPKARNPRHGMVTENGAQNFRGRDPPTTAPANRAALCIDREHERTARIATISVAKGGARSGTHPLCDTVRIRRLPAARPHLGPRRRRLRLLGHGSLARLRLRVEHLDLSPREISTSA